MGKSKTELKQTISNFKDESEKLRSSIPVSVHNQIVGTDLNVKLEGLKNYV
ncbi:hypothetical protein GCM10008983_28120 [Lentibacillus halophilus]|uniref:Uncharacterized protein n=1 Tax=Lentibacillus halophilus TaxID=295065 RepID=A0ABP3JDC4_9BACI